MTLILDGEAIRSEADFHAAARAASGVDWYSGNLDALFDLLVGVVAPPIEIVWTDAAVSRAAIGARFDRLLTVILDAQAYIGTAKLAFTLRG